MHNLETIRGLIQNVESVPSPVSRSSGGKEGAYRASGSPLPPDDLSQVVRRNSELNQRGTTALNLIDLYLLRMVDQRAGQEFNQPLHLQSFAS